MTPPDESTAHREHPWRFPPPGRLIGRGHPAGDFLEAHDWNLEHEGDGELVVLAHLPDRARNPRGQLFGGFTPTYVDLMALLTVRAGQERTAAPRWLATTNLRVDYLAPVLGPTFRIRSRLVHRGRRSYLVEIRFFDLEERPLVFALTTMLEVRSKGELGDA
ncbi:MAG TPA: PaaI family thioesterase [Thermoanaerobaculia bacterium]|nr:PaaI family thioesterase [Thermoanaerobaculia bacterium]